MLNGVVSLHNVQDAEAFVKHCIKKAGRLILTREEEEDLVATGLMILCELAQRYDPAKDKSAGLPGRTKGFYGYALFQLPKKLGDAYHSARPHHVLRTQSDGSRKYEYLDPPTSFDDLQQEPAAATRIEHLYRPSAYTCATGVTYAPPPTIASAIPRMPKLDQPFAPHVVQQLEQGYVTKEIAASLKLAVRDVTSIQASLASAIHLVQQEAA